jgi:hypothetical protein
LVFPNRHIAYLGQHIHAYLSSLKPKAATLRTDTQIQTLRQLQEIFDHYVTVLPHFSESKWIQPALNCPPTYVPEYIAGFGSSLISFAPLLGLDPAAVVKFDDQQDQVNQAADLRALNDSIQSLMVDMSGGDAVGIQQQIEGKLCEISKHLPERRSVLRARRSPERRRSFVRNDSSEPNQAPGRGFAQPV